MQRLPKFILFGTLCLLFLGGYLAWGYLRVQKLQLHIGESMRDVLAHNQRANYAPDRRMSVFAGMTHAIDDHETHLSSLLFTH